VPSKIARLLLTIARLVGARIFSLPFYGVNDHLWVKHLLTSLPGGQVGLLVFVNVPAFLLAFSQLQ
jgi:TRAP-type mannitol/chloroaromatic compound transport system permease large subunit